MKELALIFGRLGLLGFGGPVAMMAMMEEETSRKRGWFSRERFAEIYAVCKLLPGPAATQMAIYIGLERAGQAGALLAGGLFILPSFIFVLTLSYFYVRFGSMADATSMANVFGGVQAGALVVILLSTFQLSKPYRGRSESWFIAAIAAVLTVFWPRAEPLVILFFGIIGAFLVRRHPGSPDVRGTFKKKNGSGDRFLNAVSFGGLASGLIDQKLLQLFWVCFKAGAFVFGTGLAVVPMLEGDAVGLYGWLTHAEFMDGVAMGQVTPGPVVITATFIGYKTAGLAGALVATFGMFLPAFFNVMVLLPRAWKFFSGTSAAQGFSNWAIPAVIGAILGTALKLGWLTLVSPVSMVVFVLALVLAVWFRPPAWLLIPLSGLVAGAGSFLL